MGDVRVEFGSNSSKPEQNERKETEEWNFWESEIDNVRRCEKVGGERVSYFSKRNLPSFVFFFWTWKWIRVLAKRYLDPYKFHPLPLADQVLYWQPIFSRHVSDALISLESEQFARFSGVRGGLGFKSLILFRAILLTFGRRIALATVGMVAMNILSMSIAMLLGKLFRLMTSDFNYPKILGLILVIIVLELSKGICIDHVTFYIQRLIVMVDYSLGITVFHHALCLRRNYHLQKTGFTCGNAMHRCSEGSKCVENALNCPARRFKNIDVTPKMYSYKFVDCYYVTLVFDNLTDIVNFLTNFIYGIILIHVRMKIRILTVSLISVSLVTFMIFAEIFNSYLLKFYYALRDHRVGKSFEIITNFKLIKTLTLEDVAENMITDVRNDELTLVVYRFFLSLLNKILYAVIVTCALVIIIKDFVEQLKSTSDITQIDASTIITLLFILLKIIDPMFMLPVTLRLLIIVINSYNRLEFFIRTCSPNYYHSNNFINDGQVDVEMHERGVSDKCLVKYENASFTWVFSRDDLLNKKYDVYLRNVNFELKRGEIVIVTGAQGSGKSNFIKSILGEMSLVEGSMYVEPLSESMPIFYASQEVWLKRGTIRSNITFGHLFDQDIYNTVMRSVELETDIASWENGDLREITDGGFGLSGGQRVRIELARSVYAYLIYNKMSKGESFLMCLDSIFLGLDPFVGGNIFNNLFNVKSGLLVKSNLSVVLTTSKRLLECCVSTAASNTFGNVKIYSLRNKRLILRNNLKSFILNLNYSVTQPDDVEEGVVEGVRERNRGSYELYKSCKSEDFDRIPRRSVIMAQYDDKSGYGSHKIEGNRSISSIVFGPLIVYIKSAGISFFIFLLLLISCTMLDNVRYIFASKLSNFVNEQIKNVDEIRSDKEKCDAIHTLIQNYSTKSLTLITYLSIFVVITCVSVIVSMTLVSFIASLRIHEYSLDSALYNSALKVKVNRYLSDVITFLSCDTLYIDLALAYYLFDSLILLVETLIHMIMLIYLLPTSSFFVIIAMGLIIGFPMFWFIKALSNVRFSYMASTNRLNCVLNDSISGSIVYRSYRKEPELLNEFVEHADYNSRARFMERAAYTWASVTCRCIFSAMIFFIILTPITVSKIVEYDLKIGYYGLAFSLCLNFTNRFSKLLRMFTRLQLYLCSVIRFKNFIPSGQELRFEKMKNIYIEDIVTTSDVDHTGLSRLYLNRRKVEFYKLRSLLSIRSLFFKPKINLIDVTQHLPSQHSGVELKDVCVYTSTLDDSLNSVGTMILNNITVSAKKSDIIGIIGRTGAGKTTLLSVLQNTVHNRTGSVLLDGKDLNDLPTSVTHQIIGVLPQLPFVFRGWTIRRFLDPRKLFTDEQINEALDNCGLLDLVKALSSEPLDLVIVPDYYHKDMPKYFKRVYYPNLVPSHDKKRVSRTRFKLSKGLSSTMDANFVLSNTQMRTLMFARLMLYRHFYRLILIDEPPSDNCSDEPYTPSGISTPRIHTSAISAIPSPIVSPIRTQVSPQVGNTERETRQIGVPIYKLLSLYFSHCTSFIAAHDVNALRSCTQLWILSNGNLVMTCNREQMAQDESLAKIIQDCMDA